MHVKLTILLAKCQCIVSQKMNEKVKWIKYTLNVNLIVGKNIAVFALNKVDKYLSRDFVHKE